MKEKRFDYQQFDLTAKQAEEENEQIIAPIRLKARLPKQGYTRKRTSK